MEITQVLRVHKAGMSNAASWLWGRLRKKGALELVPEGGAATGQAEETVRVEEHTGQ